VASEVDICNLAIRRVGGNTIQELNPSGSLESRLCNGLFDFARDGTLRDVDWGFARRQALLAELTDTITGYDFVYKYPSDCITAREIYNSAKSNDDDLIDFIISLSSDGLQKVILTDEPTAELIYTKKVTNPALFDSMFVDALAYRIAADLAIPLRGDATIQQSFARAYGQAIGSAKATTLNERSKRPSEGSSFSDARK
jgi:hypothetical protein